MDDSMAKDSLFYWENKEVQLSKRRKFQQKTPPVEEAVFVGFSGDEGF